MNPEWILLQYPSVFFLDKKIFINNSGTHSVAHSVGTSSSFTGAKFAGVWSRPLLSDAKVKKQWSYTSIPTYAFMASTRHLHPYLMCGKLIRTMPCHGTENRLSFCYLGGHVQSEASSCGICGGQSGNGFSLSTSDSPCQCYSSPPPIYKRCYIIFPIDSVVREHISREKESSWGAIFLRTLNGLLTALKLSAPC